MGIKENTSHGAGGGIWGTKKRQSETVQTVSMSIAMYGPAAPDRLAPCIRGLTVVALVAVVVNQDVVRGLDVPAPEPERGEQVRGGRRRHPSAMIPLCAVRPWTAGGGGGGGKSDGECTVRAAGRSGLAISIM